MRRPKQRNGHAVARERMDRDRVAIGKDSRGRVITQLRPGKPKAKIDAEMLKRLLTIGCTEEECAELLEVSVDTLQTEPWRSHMRKGDYLYKMSLRRMQYLSAQSGNVTMQIWLGKNKLGQSDNGPVDAPMSWNAAMYVPQPQVFFIESDGDGRPKGYASIEEMEAAHKLLN